MTAERRNARPASLPIRIVRARTNNLKDVTLDIPKHRIVVFTGVSGSGKSSLVFDTIAAESQKQLNETYSSFVRNRLPHYGQPEADGLYHLPASIVVDQKRLGGNARSTVGTATDIYALLRLLFSRIGEPHVGESSVFSFNHPQGMCLDCQGLGNVDSIDVDSLVDWSKSLNEGPLRFPAFGVGSARWKRYALTGFFDNDKKLGKYTAAERHRLLHEDGTPVTHPLPGWYASTKYEGLIPRFKRSYLERELEELSKPERDALSRIVRREPCPACGGGRLNARILACRVRGKNIADCAAMEVGDLRDFVRSLDVPEVATVVSAMADRLHHMVNIGLDYLALDRETASLSGGESQRVKMVRHLGSSLSDIAYIFDEPSIGLHPRDVHQLTDLLTRLRDNGNTVLVVEHDPDVIAIADHVIDIGPNAGADGGRIVFEGSVDALATASTTTARALAKPRALKTRPRHASGYLQIENASMFNVSNVSVRIPLGVITVVVGVAGSGKSTLVHRILPRLHPNVVRIDQSALGGSRRSTPATYIGILDPIRDRFAAASGLPAGLFSTNSLGACPECRGIGLVRTDLAFMDAIEAPCETCDATGFSDQARSFRLDGSSIADVMKMTIPAAKDFFASDEAIRAPLERLERVGLDYMTLGQQLSSLSGGERQRLKLATELARTGRIYLFDEPTSGLHIADIEKLLRLFDELVARGDSVLIVEHNLDVMAHADWIIEMGPGAGHRGGQIVFEGTPSDLTKATSSITGPFLRKHVGDARQTRSRAN
ncbi:Excinuclease ABC subunit A [Labilithrix luteola]|uniref:UvrABC system protein A n=1 Tax=Labilithrix luteola TaxID=1391654 RepID=A0A0K1PPU1_9BACT|nr:excinuclease ABC subunit UvrA [Labilithrix luteola]AKU95543.1 Excinuclease ABC subunit A [Labilithrix luteola]